MRPEVTARVDAMLASDDGNALTAHDMASEATWADKVRDADVDGARLATRQWHFVDIELSDGDVDRACFGHPTLPAGSAAFPGQPQECVVDKIGQFRAELAGTRTEAAERLTALKFQLHFVGDVHQPLHSSDDGDRGGNSKPVVGGVGQPQPACLLGHGRGQAPGPGCRDRVSGLGRRHHARAAVGLGRRVAGVVGHGGVQAVEGGNLRDAAVARRRGQVRVDRNVRRDGRPRCRVAAFQGRRQAGMAAELGPGLRSLTPTHPSTREGMLPGAPLVGPTRFRGRLTARDPSWVRRLHGLREAIRRVYRDRTWFRSR